MATEPQSPLEPLKTGRFAGRVAFAQLIRDSLAAAAAQDWNQLILCDASFEDWPLNERAVIDSLNAWARGAAHSPSSRPSTTASCACIHGS